VKLVTYPPRMPSYGMVVSSTGVPFFAEFGSNRLASIDPDTMSIHEFVLPDAASRPRRSESAAMMRFGFRTMRAAHWAGSIRRPAAPANGRLPADLSPTLWNYGTRRYRLVQRVGCAANTLVRFDPRSEKFQTWTIPSGGGVVRNMMPTADAGSCWRRVVSEKLRSWSAVTLANESDHIG